MPPGPADRERLIREYLPLVRTIAERVRGSLPVSVSLDDLISAGVVGLIAAVDSHSASRGVRLDTYATYKIRQTILDSLRGLRSSEAIYKVAAEFNLTEREREALSGISLGLTIKELAKQMKISPHTVKAYLRVIMVKMGVSTRAAIVAKILEHSASTQEDVRFLIEDPIVQILMSAAAAFQKFETGRSWLLTPNAALGNRAPISLIATESGRELVANELGLIEHGMF